MDNNINYTAKTYEDPKRLASIDLQSNWAMTSLPEKTDRNRGLTYQSTSGVGRDNVRTPMQWNSSVNAGWNDKFVFWDSPDHQPKAKHIYDRNLKYFQADYFRGWVDEVVEPGMDSWRQFLENMEESRSSFSLDKIEAKVKEYFKRDRLAISSKDNCYHNFPIFDRTTSINPLFLNPHYKQINVQEQAQRLDSPLNFYRRLLNLRKENKVLNQGNFKQFHNFKVLSSNPMVTAYTRSSWFKKYLIIVNLDFQSQLVKIQLGYLTQDRLILNTHQGVNYQNGLLELLPYQGIVVRV